MDWENCREFAYFGIPVAADPVLSIFPLHITLKEAAELVQRDHELVVITYQSHPEFEILMTYYPCYPGGRLSTARFGLKGYFLTYDQKSIFPMLENFIKGSMEYDDERFIPRIGMDPTRSINSYIS